MFEKYADGSESKGIHKFNCKYNKNLKNLQLYFMRRLLCYFFNWVSTVEVDSYLPVRNEIENDISTSTGGILKYFDYFVLGDLTHLVSRQLVKYLYPGWDFIHGKPFFCPRTKGIERNFVPLFKH